MHYCPKFSVDHGLLKTNWPHTPRKESKMFLSYLLVVYLIILLLCCILLFVIEYKICCLFFRYLYDSNYPKDGCVEVMDCDEVISENEIRNYNFGTSENIRTIWHLRTSENYKTWKDIEATICTYSKTCFLSTSMYLDVDSVLAVTLA